MKKKRIEDPLRRRIAAAKRKVAAALEKDASAETLKAAVDDLRLLQDLEQRRWRRRSLSVVAIVVAFAILVAVVLRSSYPEYADVVLAAETRAFAVVAGHSLSELSPLAVDATKIAVSARGEETAWCGDPDAPAQPGCTAVMHLRLNGLSLDPKAAARVRVDGPCFELQILAGSGKAEITFFLPAAAAAATPVLQHPPLTLAPGDSISTCTGADVLLEMRAVSQVSIAERSAGGIAEREDIPSLVRGTLTFPAIERSVELRPTDMPRIGPLSGSTLVARLHGTIDVTLVGKTTVVLSRVGTGERNLMPTRLDWLWSHKQVKAALAILGAILSAAFALRQRFLGHVGEDS